MRYLFYVNLFVLLTLTACQSVRPRHLTSWNGALPADCQPLISDCSLPTANCPLPTPFSSPLFEKALFKASLDIREHHLTGLIFVKKMPLLRSARNDNDAGYRMVFSNEFGMTYFDVEIGNNLFKLKYCFEPLNKKVLWKILQTDLRLLFASEASVGSPEYYLQDQSNYIVIRNKQQNLTRWDLFEYSCDTLAEIRGKSNIADQVKLSFSTFREGFPSRISIDNPIIKLKISLSLLSLN